MKLGIFDSGIGGEAIASSLKKSFPDFDIQTVNDKHNVPYGSKTAEQVIQLTDTAIQPLLQSSCDIIVLACNTATAFAIETLRSKYPNQKFIGIEPMVKTAANLTKSKTVSVCATPATLASNRYGQLVKTYGSALDIIEPDCSDWARMIEDNKINHQAIKSTVESVCSKGADVIVLGCTHYHWIKDLIVEVADGSATVIEPSDAIANRVASMLNIES
jgi:glutamate racemase